MKTIAWNDEKDAVLRADLDRGGIGLAECAEMIESGNLLAVVPNPSANHGDQQMYVLNIAGNGSVMNSVYGLWPMRVLATVTH